MILDLTTQTDVLVENDEPIEGGFRFSLYQLVFDNIQVGDSSSYNVETGILTIPETGVYEFQLDVAMAVDGNDDMDLFHAWVEVRQDKHMLYSDYTDETDVNDDGEVWYNWALAGRTILALTAGDPVRIMVKADVPYRIVPQLNNLGDMITKTHLCVIRH